MMASSGERLANLLFFIIFFFPTIIISFTIRKKKKCFKGSQRPAAGSHTASAAWVASSILSGALPLQGRWSRRLSPRAGARPLHLGDLTKYMAHCSGQWMLLTKLNPQLPLELVNPWGLLGLQPKTRA